jgi:hypothetical protein
VLVFASRNALSASPLQDVSLAFPDIPCIGCSTAIETAWSSIGNSNESFRVGQSLAASIPPEGLRHAFVLSDGLAWKLSGTRHPLPEGRPLGTGS